MPLLGKFAATKAIAAVLGALVLIGLRSKEVSITQPVLGVKSGNVTVSTKLVRAFPEELEKIILSGTPVTLRLKIVLFRDGKSEKEKVVKRKVSYELLSSVFLVNSEDGSEKVSDRAKMKELMSGFEQIEIIPLGNISARSRYTAMVKAFLEPIEVEAIEEEEFDLMVFWKYSVPHSK